jgi:hypothetical protein
MKADDAPPREGTRAAIRYWSARTREALRVVDTYLSEAERYEGAASWATDAAGCAGEVECAVEAFNATRTA